ncbi:MAG: SAF domain-containing protein [Candidatus Dormibacteraeota bacterium]|nr:SAF domain-containing protein [Candidatus Dormibacteraeota bacterium]
MTIAAQRTDRSKMVASTVERRWRIAILLGLILTLGLATYALLFAGPAAQSNGMVGVLKATKDIRAGTQITADAVGVAQIRAADPALLQTLVLSSDRARVIGQTSAVDVPAGHLVPTGVAAAQATAQMWIANVPVRRASANLKPGDHVALLVNGTAANGVPIEFVYLQDVEVLNVGSGSADLWLQPKFAAQVEWYADHGGIVLLKMQPGAVQEKLPAGGGT